MFRSILVGFDGSPMSKEALQTAIALAARIGGQVDVVAVVPPNADDALPAWLRVEANEFRPDAATGVAYTVRIVEGTRPAEVLAAECHEHAFDLLVLGRHDQGGSRAGRLGPVAHRLVERAPTPVLIVGQDRDQTVPE